MKPIYFLASIIILYIATSCSFPNKSIQHKITRIENDLNLIKSLIFKETNANIYSMQVDKIKNTELKNLLLRFKVSEITVQYKHMESISSLKKQNIAYSYDSTVILSFTKSTDDKIISENLIYFFSTIKPKHVSQNLFGFKEKKINDSIWFQKNTSDIIVVN